MQHNTSPKSAASAILLLLPHQPTNQPKVKVEGSILGVTIFVRGG